MVEDVERLRCLVMGCQNYQGQGTFIGDLCAPCHEMITTGRVHHANITFIGDFSRKTAEWDKRFDMFYDAQMRGVEAWRKAHPGNELVMPDMAKMTEWLVEEVVQLRRVVEGEREARQKIEVAYRAKDEAMGVLFERLRRVGVDCSDLIS